MSSVTYSAMPAAAGKSAVKTAAKSGRPGFWRRWLDRMVEARMRQAMEEVRRHGVILPRQLDKPEWKTTKRSEDSLPFVR
jgi:hypothetical protein